MVLVQVDLSEDENYNLDVYTVLNKLERKTDGIKHILRNKKLLRVP